MYRNELEEWLDQNYWFEVGSISVINDSKNGLEIQSDIKQLQHIPQDKTI